MATIGLSKPYFAIYNNSGTTVTYTGGGVLGKATQLDISLNSSESNILYADNGPAESDDTFTGGTVSISVDELRPDVMQAVLGMTTETITNAAVTTPGAAWMVNSDNQNIPYLGLGGVAKKKVGGVTYFVGIVLDKIRFRNLNDSITTQGETVEWQVPTLEGDLFRSDTSDHRWRRVSTLLETEAEAEAAVKGYLSVA